MRKESDVAALAAMHWMKNSDSLRRYFYYTDIGICIEGIPKASARVQVSHRINRPLMSRGKRGNGRRERVSENNTIELNAEVVPGTEVLQTVKWRKYDSSRERERGTNTVQCVQKEVKCTSINDDSIIVLDCTRYLWKSTW